MNVYNVVYGSTDTHVYPFSLPLLILSHVNVRSYAVCDIVTFPSVRPFVTLRYCQNTLTLRHHVTSFLQTSYYEMPTVSPLTGQ